MKTPPFSFISEILLILVLLSFSFLLLDPLDLAMGSMMYMTAVPLASLVYLASILFFWKEKAHDEREMEHRFYASRGAFLVGSGILMIGIILESLSHHVDIWLPMSLVGMSIAKLVINAYLSKNK